MNFTLQLILAILSLVFKAYLLGFTEGFQLVRFEKKGVVWTRELCVLSSQFLGTTNQESYTANKEESALHEMSITFLSVYCNSEASPISPSKSSFI